MVSEEKVESAQRNLAESGNPAEHVALMASGAKMLSEVKAGAQSLSSKSRSFHSFSSGTLLVHFHELSDTTLRSDEYPLQPAGPV